MLCLERTASKGFEAGLDVNIYQRKMDQHSTLLTRLPDLVYIGPFGLYPLHLIPYLYRDFQYLRSKE